MENVFYLDMYLLNNTIINCILIFFSIKTNKLTICKLRMIAVSIISSVISIPILFCNKFVLIIFKSIMPFIMCNYSIKKASAKQTVKLVLSFWMLSLILSGVFTVLNATTDFVLIKNIRFGVTSYSTICIASFVFYLLCKFALNLLSRQLKSENTYKTVEITINGLDIVLIGFCDNGNTLLDTKSGLPIFITDNKRIRNIFDFQKNLCHYVNCSTILGQGEIAVITPDSVTIDKKRVNALIGLSDYEFCSDYDILLNPRYQSQLATNSFEETENIYV